MELKKLIFIIAAFFSLYSCEQEAEMSSKDYPFVTLNNIEVDTDNVKFNATITNYADISVDKYGFIWEEADADLNINTSFLEYTNLINENGEYSITVNNDLIKGNTYYVQPIAIQGQKTIIGNRMWFESNGSKQPIITNFYPGNGNSGDTINIEGRYFSD
jgi:hypothetical protein